MSSLLTRLRLSLNNRFWQWRLRQTHRFLAGSRRWEALDRLGVPGFGLDLVRVDFPPDLGHATDWAPARACLAPLFDANRKSQLALLRAALAHAPDLSRLPVSPADDTDVRPWLENPFLGLHDIVILHGLLLHLQPRRYIEIGSGVSTRVAALARDRSPRPFRICSFDPEPRAAIASLCDEVHRDRLEHVIPQILELARPGDVIFFDGSHRAFPGSDVTLFFLSLLPRLPSGVIVQIHDIYLPADYPTDLRPRLWSEQYLFAAWLLGGAHRIEIMLPCAHLLSLPEGEALIAPVVNAAPPHRGLTHSLGCSLWFKTI